jgi:DMSO reductase anchor subunit
MRPTFSIICFTVLSGVGYGAWLLVGLGYVIGPQCMQRYDAGGMSATMQCGEPFITLPGFLLATALVCAGLLCSLGHLGKPLRAWRALSQWRSSWLSREGVLALLTFIPAAWLLAREIAMPFVAIRSSPDWMPMLEYSSNISLHSRLLGFTLAIGSLATVYCTANIYASLKPIRAWRERHVVPAYLLLSLYSGSLLLLGSGAVWFRALLAVVIGLAIASAWLKHRYWRAIDALPAPDAGNATGLAELGTVRSFEAPHTEENYLTHEMGFVLARKHARKLRKIALVFAFLVPALLALFALVMPAIGMPAAWVALASGLAGLFVERWLFFAEAKHAVMAYYAR